MKRSIMAVVFVVLMGVSQPAHAAITDWPVVGQVLRVVKCIAGGTGSLVTSFLSHLSQWGSEALTTVGHCSLETAEETIDVVEDVVSLNIPTPDPTPVTDADVEVVNE